MNNSPLSISLSMLVASVTGYLWWQDLRANRNGTPNPTALPGAAGCSRKFLTTATLGGIFLVALESTGEILLGLADEQKDITAFFLGAMLAAAIVEEIIFRGYIVISNQGRAWLVTSAIGASLLFALAHDFLWQYKPAEGMPWWYLTEAISPSVTIKAWYSFGFAFAVSLYFYWLRFHPRNSSRSLLPCFLAHAARNMTVFAIKAAQGHVTGWF